MQRTVPYSGKVRTSGLFLPTLGLCCSVSHTSLVNLGGGSAGEVCTLRHCWLERHTGPYSYMV